MTEHDFQIQFARLVDAFGKTHYSSERAKIIWADVRALSVEWFKRTVTTLISSSRQAPLPADIQSHAIEERNRIYEQEKATHRRDAENFMNPELHTEEVRHIVSSITARMRGEMTAEDWNQFLRLLEKEKRRA